MREITLTRGYTAQIDDADFERVSQFKWTAQPVKRKDGTISKVYAYRKGFRLHRFILGIINPTIEVDHRDGNGLNCQRYNLRPVTHAQNMRNHGMNLSNTSGFDGVSKTENGKWRAIIKVDGKQLYLGRFVDVLDADKAVKQAKTKYHEF